MFSRDAQRSATFRNIVFCPLRPFRPLCHSLMFLLDPLVTVGRSVHFAARSFAASFLAVRRPRDVLQQLYDVHVGALPV